MATAYALPAQPIIRTPGGDVKRRLARSPYFWLGLAILLIIGAGALFAPVLAGHDPVEQNGSAILAGPSSAHWLGTDELGRDTRSRVTFGARTSLGVGVLAVTFALIIGVGIGLIAGYVRGRIDAVLMRTIDGLLAFPALVLALAITATLGPSVANAIVAIGVTGVPAFARLVRGQVLAIRELDYVAAARALGLDDTRIILRHVLPAALSPIIVQASLAIPSAILAEAALSFLGLGVTPPTPSWGNMINSAKGYLETNPLLVLAPGGAIFVSVLGWNFLGDALRDALDPRLGR